MLKVNFLHICDTALVDTNGKLSIIGIFENINSNNFPAKHPQMAIVIGFESDKSETYGIEISFLDEKDEILKVQTNVKIGSNRKGTLIQQMVLYEIPRDLTQKIKVNFEGNTIHTDYITINGK